MCKCRQKQVNGSNGATVASLLEGAMNEEIIFAPLNLKAGAPLGSKVFVPARVDKALRGLVVPNYKARILTVLSHQQSVPTVISDWMRGDYRYRDWFAEEAPEIPAADEEESLEPLLTENDGLNTQENGEAAVSPKDLSTGNDGLDVVETPVVSIFDAWMVEDIEEANLSGEDGLLAYAAAKGIELGDAKLKGDVLAAILEWHDAQLG